MERIKNYCNNCGNYGHLYKNCRHPILSYGIILYYKDGDEIKIILVERKDTLSYIEFLRGKYKELDNIVFIKLLIDRFSNDEKERILKYEFDELWDKLWINLNTINKKIKNEYYDSKILFNKLREGYYLNNEFIKLEDLILGSKKSYIYNEWEFPKGRRENKETNLKCAIREFVEETNIKCGDYKLINNIIPITEEYIGTNDIHYKHVYYIGILTNKDIKLSCDSEFQKLEVKNIQWNTMKECIEYIREYDDIKKNIINKTFKFISKYEDHGFIK